MTVMAVNIQVTLQDIWGAQRDGAENPISRALRRIMGTPWFITDQKHSGGTIVYELAEPYRVAILDAETSHNWHQYRSSGLIWPFECEISIDDKEHP